METKKIEVRVTEAYVGVKAPYHPDFAPRAKALGGRWSVWESEWTFDCRDEARVRDLCRAVFGTDGSGPVPTVTVRHRVSLNEAYKRHLWLVGREVAWRPGRDARVRLGDGVIVVEGAFPPSGGSRRYPALGGGGTVLEIRDAPASLVREDEATWVVEGEENLNPLSAFSTEELLEELRRRGAL